MKKFFLIIVAATLIFSSCTKNYVIVGEENNEPTESINFVPPINQINFGKYAEFTLLYEGNTDLGAEIQGRVTDENGVIVRYINSIVLLDESGNIGFTMYSPNPDEDYFLVLINKEGGSNFKFKVNGAEVERVIIPIDVDASPNGEISYLNLQSHDLDKGDSNLQVVGTIGITVTDGPINLERIDWILAEDDDEPYDVLENIVIRDENGNTIVSNNDIDDEAEWQNANSNRPRLRFSGLNVVLRPGHYEFKIYVKVSVSQNHPDVDFEQKISVRYLNLSGITSIINSDWEDFEID